MSDATGRRSSDTDDFQPRLLSEEEIEMYLKGDRHEVDRLILTSLNRLAACVIPHARREDERDAAQDRLIASLGGEEAMTRRADFVDGLIQQQCVRTRMMEKVSQSSITWALLAFFGFLAAATWDALVNAIKIKLGG